MVPCHSGNKKMQSHKAHDDMQSHKATMLNGTEANIGNPCIAQMQSFFHGNVGFGDGWLVQGCPWWVQSPSFGQCDSWQTAGLPFLDVPNFHQSGQNIVDMQMHLDFCNTYMVPLVWYSTASPLQHWVWFTLAHKLLWAFAMGSPNNLAKVCKVALLAGLLGSKYSPSLNTSCWSSLQISWERTCSSKLVSKFWVFCRACAKAPIGLCFLSLAKHDTNLPNLWWASPMWNCQCHFLINGMSGQACWKVVMAFSAACTRVSLLMRFAKLPSWIWSIKLGMASRAAQALGWCFCGLATECTKCLTTGNKAKHSLAWQLILWLFLWLATFFFRKKVPRCGVLEFFGNATKGKIFQKLPDAEVFFDGTKKMVKANRCCALEDPMHWVMGKLAAWFQ